MESYTNFAYVYDTFMDQEPYWMWADRFCRLLELYGLPRETDIKAGSETAGETGRTDFKAKCETGVKTDITAEPETAGEYLAEERNIVVDLGCGTGKLTELLASRGCDMIGIDLSEDMLAIAQQRKIEAGSSTLYTLQDMRDFELYGAAGAMVSAGDSINYLLKEEDLEAMFRCVERGLLPGGVFVFDFKTIHLYRDVIGDSTIAENRDDCAFIWDNYYDPETCINEYDLTIFVSKEGLEVFPDDYPYPYDDPWKKEGALFHRFRETHFQRGYEPDQLRHAAESAGLTWITAQDAETGEEITETTERAMAVVRKSAQM
ncbi:MAG: class I SAM-dependent methyltransferase [Sarcina sp.]|nr:class I SAM-dependent methyltransferase [Sarcina sp.]